MLEFIFDQTKARLHIKYTGFWTMAQSRAALDEFSVYVKRLAAKGGFTLLDDMSEWMPQALDVVEANTEFGLICAHLPIVRNAMIVPSPLIRRQVLRTVQALECGLFERYAEADAWLSEVEPARGTA